MTWSAACRVFDWCQKTRTHYPLYAQSQLNANTMSKKQRLPNAHYRRIRLTYSYWTLFLGSWLGPMVTMAQSDQLSGRFVDQQGALVGVPVTLVAQSDTTQKQYTLTDTNGVFRFSGLSRQTYALRATYLGFQQFAQTVVVQQPVVTLGNLVLHDQARTLQGVTVVGQALSVRQKGDTIQFNANAYKVGQDAMVEDLVRKMPGLTLDNGSLKSQGQTVQQVLVDGKPFFGDDPAIALRNLPANLIDKVEVFDQLSEQARFSGIRDGNTVKTVNIVTRADRQNSTFGRLYAGKGTADTYQAGGAINLFRGKQRLSILGLANTINQQNFSTQDLLGVTSGGPPKPPGPPGSSGTFQVGQQPGVNQTKSVGINFSDTWANRITVQGSYFLNSTLNNNRQFDNRYYFLPGQTNQVYQATTTGESKTTNHRLNLRLEYTIDPQNSVVLTSQFTNQKSRSDSHLSAQTTFSDRAQPNHQTTQYQQQGWGYTATNALVLRHRFGKVGRTISADLATTVLTRETDRVQLTQIDSLSVGTNGPFSQQGSWLRTPTRQVSLNTVYTEPLSSVSQLHITYNRAYQFGQSTVDTRFIDSTTHAYGALNRLLSNAFVSDYRTNRVMLGYHLHTQTVGFVVDMAYQEATLSGEQTFPTQTSIRKSFLNWLPAAHLEYKPNATNQWHIEYRTMMQPPSVSQLQPVIDNANPLLIQTGNPALKPAYGHTVQARYTHTSGSRSVLVLVSGNRTQQYIGSSTHISDGTTQLINDTLLAKGVQLVKPVNLTGYQTINTQVTYSQLLPFIKTNLSLQTGYAYSQIPSQLNDLRNDQHESALNQRITLGSTISRALDFYLSYALLYSRIRNTVQRISGNRYVYQTVEGRLGWEFGSGYRLQTDITDQTYRSFSGQRNQQYTLWNIAASRKFLKARQGELKLAVFDLLNQNAAVSQNLTDTYFQTTQSLALQRYFLLTFTYTLRPSGSHEQSDRGSQRTN